MHAVAAADEAHPHALVVELGRLRRIARRTSPSALDLVRRAGPVLGRERVDRQLAHAEVDGVAEARLDRVGAGPVALGDVGSPGCRGPAAVAVGDDRDVASAGLAGPLTPRGSLLPCPSASSSISLTLSSVSFCSSVSARCSSSIPASPASRSSRRSCMKSRRMLRTATRPSSARSADHLDQLLAALLGELGDLQPDDRAVVVRRQAEVGLEDRPLDRLDRRLVVGLDRSAAAPRGGDRWRAG